jgi:hypothetical protein
MQDKPQTERQRYWLEHIQSWNKSGKRMSEYARDQGFPVRAMYDAKKALVQKGILPRVNLHARLIHFDKFLHLIIDPPHSHQLAALTTY